MTLTPSLTAAVDNARHAPDYRAIQDLSDDACVARVSAFHNVADMMDTARTYCPKFCVTAADSGVEAAMMIRAAQAFNTAAAKSGQNRRAMFF